MRITLLMLLFLGTCLTLPAMAQSSSEFCGPETLAPTLRCPKTDALVCFCNLRPKQLGQTTLVHHPSLAGLDFWASPPRHLHRNKQPGWVFPEWLATEPPTPPPQP